MRAHRLLAVAALALGAAPPLLAHDLWIEPTSFSPRPGQVVGVQLRVGMNLAGDPVPRVPALVNQFVAARAAERKPVLGRDGGDPIQFDGEFLHAFLNSERLRSHLPVNVTRGGSQIHAEGFDYDNVTRVVHYKGRVQASFIVSKGRQR